LPFAFVFAFVFGLAFGAGLATGLAGAIDTCRVTAVPVCDPSADTGVRVRRLVASAERRSESRALFGTENRRSFSPGRIVELPSDREPSVAFTDPSPLDSTISRICVAVADSFRSCGPKTEIAGDTLEDVTGTTWPYVDAGAGGGDAVAGFVVSTVSEYVTWKSAVSTAVEELEVYEAFGRERKPSPVVQSHVSHGMDAVAVLPLIERGTAMVPPPSQ
jgi:hypothetical protein